MIAMLHDLSPVAIARTPFPEKFGIPRQPNIASAATASIELLPPFNQPQALLGLEQYTHIWLLFIFNGAPATPQTHKTPKLTVRPPRLGGNERIGVFATRSTHRPNGIGQSVVALQKVEDTRLIVSGVDLLDNTPIIDIKPYLPYADAVPDARSLVAQEAPPVLDVTWEPSAQRWANDYENRLQRPLYELVNQCLRQDPKPAYQHAHNRTYGMRLWDVNVQFTYRNKDGILVTAITHIADNR